MNSTIARISNDRDGHAAVSCKMNFKGSNTYGETLPNGIYVAYSYGTHFPLYICKNCVWYGNSDKYSVTTGRHRSQLMPVNKEDITWLDTEAMRALLEGGTNER